MSHIKHKCTVWDYCFLKDESYKILFCIFCHKVIGYEKDGKAYKIDYDRTEYSKKEYSPETLNDSV